MYPNLGVVSSVEEAIDLIHKDLKFPILVIPFGEHAEVTSHVVTDKEGIENAVKKALKASYCQPGKVHLISKAGFPGDYWKKSRELTLFP